jgi:dTDP-4-dehydrorhamnose reductase
VRLLLIGRTGQLGGDLLRNGTDHDWIAPGRDELDVEKPEQVRAAIAAARPEAVINCAAFHNVPLCEEQPERAFRVNCVAMRDLARACVEVGTRLVTFSSDYVFGGERRTPWAEDDLPAPVQMYGLSRLAGEHAVLATAPAIVIRTCGLYGASGARSKGGNFVDGRLAEVRAGKTIEMACEQTVAPTSTADLSRAVLALVARQDASPGIYHLTSEGQCSWYEFTVAISELSGTPTKVVPVDRGGLSGAMRRPLYSVLANTRARKLGLVMPHWRDSLERYLRTR